MTRAVNHGSLSSNVLQLLPAMCALVTNSIGTAHPSKRLCNRGTSKLYILFSAICQASDNSFDELTIIQFLYRY